MRGSRESICLERWLSGEGAGVGLEGGQMAGIPGVITIVQGVGVGEEAGLIAVRMGLGAGD